MLATLYPSRIDLGIGRAPGGAELASGALAFPGKSRDAASYETQASLLAGFANGDLPAEHRVSANCA